VGIGHSTLCKWQRAQRKAKLIGQRSGRRFTPEERRAAVEAFLKSGRSREDFALLWGCSPSSIDKWLKRYRDEGPKGLETRVRVRKPCRPHPKRFPDHVRDLIEKVYREHPGFGMKRLAQHLGRFHGVKISSSGARKILRERGVELLSAPKKRAKPKSKPPRRFERSRPGQMWQSDITSFVLRRHSRRVYLTVFLDDHSRYVVAWRLSSRQTAPLVIDTVLDGIARYGKPEEVLTDQGRQYFAWRGKSAFQKLLAKEGIQHVVSRAHHPQTLGKCERLWQTVGDEFWDRAVPQELDDARARLGHWFRHYNHFRTHQGINGLVPADRFFGATSAVREALEKDLTRNELRMALDQAPRRSVYLVGQIGSQRISLHGERGKLLVDTPDGGRQELSMNDLGLEHEEKSDDDKRRSAQRNDRSEPELTTSAGVEASAAQTRGPQAHGIPESSAGSMAGEGSVGERAASGAGACPQDVHGDLGILAGQEDQGPGRNGLGRDAAACLAAKSEGAIGDDGGALDATAHASESRSLRAQDGGGPGDAPEAHRGSGEGAVADGGLGARATNGPVGDVELGLTSEGRKKPCEEVQAQEGEASQEASRGRSEYGSEPCSGRSPTRRRSWLRWLKE